MAWYEAHLKSEEGWDVHGGLFPGMPFIAKGFNPDIGWGVTVNKPDLVDIYKLELNPKTPTNIYWTGCMLHLKSGASG